MASKKRSVTKKKKSTRKKISGTKTSAKNIALEKALMENTLALQKITTNLAIKFDALSKQISKLLELFETSAQTLAEKEIKNQETPQESKKLDEQMEKLFEQNKIIARSLSLLHESQQNKQNTEGYSSPPMHQEEIPAQSPSIMQSNPKTNSYQEPISQKPRTKSLAEV